MSPNSVKRRSAPARAAGEIDVAPSLAERFEAAKGRRSVRSIASAAGIAEGTLRAWLRGGSGRSNTLARVANALGVRLEWLASGREPMLTKTPLQMAFGREQIVLVPVFEVVAAAVHPAFDWMPEGDPIARVALPLEAVRVQMNSTPEALVAIPVVGRSMEPMYREGELALIDRTCTEVPPAGGHYLLRTPDGLRIKHVKLECGHLVLSSVNAAEFPPERLGAAEALVIQVLGRVAGTQPDPRCARIDPAP